MNNSYKIVLMAITGAQAARPQAVRSDEVSAATRAANAASLGVLVVEVIGSLSMWALIPVAWLWVGGRLFIATGSLGADLGVAFLGFVVTTVVVLAALNRIDGVWITLRRRAGHDQAEGALPQVVVITTVLGMLMFLIWYYLLSSVFVMPFMPSR